MAGHDEHRYRATTIWDGSAAPTRDYESYSRDYRVEVPGRPALRGSADAAFRGDAGLHNPEDLMVAALSACHMLWYLHLCADGGVVVIRYEDSAEGVMVAAPGNGRFSDVILRPVVTITADSDAAKADSLHARAHAECFIANSVNFPIRCEATIVKAGDA